MGGQQSTHYRQFQQYCSEAYIILRKRGELFINLMMLMKDANIPVGALLPLAAERGGVLTCATLVVSGPHGRIHAGHG